MRSLFKSKPSPYTPEIFKGIGRGMGPGGAIPGGVWSNLMNPGDESIGMEPGMLRNFLQGKPAKRTNMFGQSVTNYSGSDWRYRLVNTLLGKRK